MRLTFAVAQATWYNDSDRTHHASDFHAQLGGTFSFMGGDYVSISKTNINNSTADTIIY